MLSEEVYPLTQAQGQVSGRGDGFSGEVHFPWQQFYPPATLIPSEFSNLWGTAEAGSCIISSPSSWRWFVNINFPQYFKGRFHLPGQEEKYFSGLTIVSHFAPCFRSILKIPITPMEIQRGVFLLNHPFTYSPRAAALLLPIYHEYNRRARGNDPVHFLRSCVRYKQPVANRLGLKSGQKRTTHINCSAPFRCVASIQLILSSIVTMSWTLFSFSINPATQ